MMKKLWLPGMVAGLLGPLAIPLYADGITEVTVVDTVLSPAAQTPAVMPVTPEAASAPNAAFQASLLTYIKANPYVATLAILGGSMGMLIQLNTAAPTAVTTTAASTTAAKFPLIANVLTFLQANPYVGTLALAGGSIGMLIQLNTTVSAKVREAWRWVKGHNPMAPTTKNKV